MMMLSTAKRSGTQVVTPAIASEQREYEAIMAQIKNILLLASEEPPPGEDASSIAYRIDVLQQALGAVERRAKEKQLQQDMSRTVLLNKRQERLVEQSAQRQEKLTRKLEERQKMMKQIEEDRKYMLIQKHSVIDSRTDLVKEHAYNTFTNAFAKSEAERKRRENAVERVYEERARAVKEHIDRTRQRIEQNRLALQQKLKMEKMQRNQREQRIKRHEIMMLKRQKMAEEKRNEFERMQFSASRHNELNSFISQRRNPDSELKRDARRSLMEELEEKEKQHKARYEEEQMMRRYEIEKRALRHKERLEKQRKRYSEKLDERIRRGDEIIAKALDKKRRGEKAQENRQKQEADSGLVFAREAEEHKRRAEALQAQRREKFLKQNYLRWNERAAAVMQHLHDVFPSDENNVVNDEKKTGFLPSLSPFLLDKETDTKDAHTAAARGGC
uniref:Uncharacterized protein n=1 Tax=Trypanosoma congolense (strain IL3000) TaxID=1068625 RepID=G0UZB6_TRYCI|nr:conserved hypothetical protein [Trypanosoma congolense IL3000]